MRKAFTLIELLVVIAIIALLLAIVAPALSKAKRYAQRIICANRIRQQSLGVLLYANENANFVPTTGGSPWLWDMTFWTTNEISRYAGFDDNEIFFCPANRIKKHDDARFWQFTWDAAFMGANLSSPVPIKEESQLTAAQQRSEYRVLPMIYMFDRYNSSGDSILPTTLVDGRKAQWIRKLTKVKSAGSQPMIMDATISQRNDWNFFNITAGGIGGLSMGTLVDTSNHQSNQTIYSNTGSQSGPKPEGSNIGFADGHVKWRKFSDMQFRLDRGMWFWW